MPATRLRNHDWHRSLQQVMERGGSLDVAIATDLNQEEGQKDGVNVLWRVRLFELREQELVVEQPATLGTPVLLNDQIEVVVIFSIGQNRWMFRTSVRGRTSHAGSGSWGGPRTMAALRLAMPQLVERCQRRTNFRISTASLNLPQVDMWPLLDPKTVIVAERANELQSTSTVIAERGSDELRLPSVGPSFSGVLLNLGGGGVGVSIANDCSQHLLRHKLFWVRLALPPDLDVPVCATTKLVHTHMTAQQDYYAGLAFDFTFNPAHQKFVVEQIGRYVAHTQRRQVMRQAG